MHSGNFTFENVDLSIGGEENDGLKLKRVFAYQDNVSATVDQAFGTFFTTNWDISVRQRRMPAAGACYPSQYDYSVNVVFADLGEGFSSRFSPIEFKQVAPNGYAELTYTGNPQNNVTYTFIARDGSTVLFNPLTTAGVCAGGWASCAWASVITRPDGTRFTLGYDTTSGRPRLRNVVSNRGYALLFEYTGTSLQISKACILNLALVTKPSDDICPAGARSATYSYSGDVQVSASLPDQGVWSFSHNATAKTFSLTRPGDTNPYVTNTYMLSRGTADEESILSVTNQAFAVGAGYSYNWNVVTNVSQNDGSTSILMAGGSWTDGDSKTVSVEYGHYTKQAYDAPLGDPSEYVTPGPVRVTNQLNYTTLFDYCGFTTTTGYCPYLQIPPQQSSTNPEGDSESYTYTSYNNLYQTLRKPKPGSSISNATETRNYLPFGSATPVDRAKPTSIVDWRDYTTSYAYSPVHGGILRETRPEAPNGVAPVKRYTYAQRYAWTANGSGGYVAGSYPVWLLTEERTCRMTATVGDACDGGSVDEVVTTYDYGPDSGPNNLLLRGTLITAYNMSLRTCYGYDAYGNRISETKPRAMLTSCP